MKIPKSYRYYKLSDLKAVFQVEQKSVADLLTPVTPVEPSDLLVRLMKRNMQLPLKNEKSKSELIVMPLLAEVWDTNQNFKPLSGISFNIEPEKGLKGVCDFLVSSKPDSVDLQSPVVCVYEAKDDNIENWYGQCGAEMYAARIFNEREGNGIKTVHGAVTNGFTWQFLKLEDKTLSIDNRRYALANLPELLGAIQKVYDFYLPA